MTATALYEIETTEADNGTTPPEQLWTPGEDAERDGPCIAHLDPETAVTSVWTETCAWVGTVTHPDTAGDLIDAYENGGRQR
ncbi:hypothetical protein [Wenjunlia tyrosinilytica]|uniref:Uncharacterized protein n=1 Tax=Wenjunlia tyrosinilytica TaxID=1544741 RepID=A0A918E0Y1_9ACTN|nr:hypothetical protein [Wenjunlia tyrosinilytica]GGO94577.1 hypothetical protein GCM10012280_49810 [Wenjunlia tyrosinilytica]